MKKTKILAIDMAKVNEVIKGLEKDNFEIVQFNHEVASNGHIYAFLMAQKEDDKSVYEKIYLLEKYCATKGGCKGCEIENICHGKYEGIGAVYWDFEDVKKAYEVMRDGDR